MATAIQTFRYEELSLRTGMSPRGKGINGQNSPTLRVTLFPIDTGIAGLNLRFSRDEIGDGFFSPRHHHNFDQFRYMLSGSMNIGKGVDLNEGECGYFPEGTYYGPLAQKGDAVLLAMQFPGPNAAYYMLASEQEAAIQALLSAGGVFENGVYKHKLDGGRSVNQDGFEAAWEQHAGHPIKYADHRYPAPVVMRPQSYRWVPDPQQTGVHIKHLGTFNEYRTNIALWQMAPGTSVKSEILDAPEIRYVLRGVTTYDGKELAANSLYYVPNGLATHPMESQTGAELLVISLPMYVPSVWAQAQGRAAIAV